MISARALVGNDVVDLRDPQSQPTTIHPRWDSRVFTSEERRQLLDAGSAHRVRWKMWAAKESAFKVAKKLAPDLPFFPTAFSVEHSGPGSARVRHEVGGFQVELHETADYVHAVATPDQFSGASLRVSSTLESLGEGPRATALPSQRVRDLARDAIGAALAVDPSAIDISTVGGIPVASSEGTLLPIDLSFSHHGRFVACAWVSRIFGSEANLLPS